MDAKFKVALVAGLDAAGWSEEEIDASVSRCAMVWAAAEIPVRTAPEGQLGGTAAQVALADAIAQRIGAAWLGAEMDRVNTARPLRSAARDAWDAALESSADAAKHEAW